MRNIAKLMGSVSIMILLALFFQLFNADETTSAASDNVPNQVSRIKKSRPMSRLAVKQPLKQPAKKVAVQAATNVVTVKNWAELVAAYNDSDTTEIDFANDIDGTSGNSVKNRKTSITIDGKGYKLNLGNSHRFMIDWHNTATFTLKNIPEIKSNSSTVTGIVDQGVDAGVVNSGWTVNISDVSSDRNMRPRIASIPGGQLNLGGDITWYTKSEMAVTTGVNVLPNAHVEGRKITANGGIDDRSFFWYPNSDFRGVGSGDFVVGDHATAVFKMEGGGTSYPVVFAYYKNLHLGKDVTFNATMPGNAFRSDYYASNFIADGQDNINFTSLRAGYAPIDFNSGAEAKQDAVFTVGPQSQFFVIGPNAVPLINGRNSNDAKRRSVLIDSPLNYDIRNNTKGTGTGASVASTNLKSFKIINSDVNLWETAANPMGGASFYAPDVKSVEQLMDGTITSDNTDLAAHFKTANNRRISGFNQVPKVIPTTVTNAEYSYRVRIKVADVPDDSGMDDNGHIPTHPQYAAKDQALVTLTDTNGKTTQVKTDSDGYATATKKYFQTAGKQITATAVVGKRTSDTVKETVTDVVPPLPTNVDQATANSDLYVNTKTLSVSAANTKQQRDEVGATVMYTINGQPAQDAMGQPLKTTVDSQGYWSLPISQPLQVGDTVQIFLTDQNGNQEPAADTQIHDYLAKAAAKYTVKAVPVNDQISYQVRNLTDKTDYKNQIVGHAEDTVQYQFKYTIDQASQAYLASGQLKNQLPTNVTPDISSIELIYSSGQQQTVTSLDQIKLKPVKQGESVLVRFKAKIAKSVNVGDQLIANTQLTAKTLGNDDYTHKAETKITIEKPVAGKITFKYIDQDTQQAIAEAPAVTISGISGHPVSEYTTEQLAPKYIDGYTVVQMKANDATAEKATKADPILTSQPQTYTYYYEKAALSIEVPHGWNFGDYQTTQTDATYYLPSQKDNQGQKVPYSVNVNDTYGVKDWVLNVQQTAQFKGYDAATKKKVTLDDAQLKFRHTRAKMLTQGQNEADQLSELTGGQFELTAEQTPLALMAYHKDGHYLAPDNQDTNGTKYDNPGIKSAAYQFGDTKTADNSIGLFVPEKTKRYQTNYQTTIKWSLSVAP